MEEQTQQTPSSNGEKLEGKDENGRFTEGNKFGKGRPKGSLSLVGLLRKELEEMVNVKDSTDKKQLAEVLIKKYLKKAINDEDASTIRDIINRIDGMPTQPIGFDDTVDNVNITIVRNQNGLKSETDASIREES